MLHDQFQQDIISEYDFLKIRYLIMLQEYEDLVKELKKGRK